MFGVVARSVRSVRRMAGVREVIGLESRSVGFVFMRVGKAIRY